MSTPGATRSSPGAQGLLRVQALQSLVVKLGIVPIYMIYLQQKFKICWKYFQVVRIADCTL
jgi:hypothetical protein